MKRGMRGALLRAVLAGACIVALAPGRLAWAGNDTQKGEDKDIIDPVDGLPGNPGGAGSDGGHGGSAVADSGNLVVNGDTDNSATATGGNGGYGGLGGDGIPTGADAGRGGNGGNGGNASATAKTTAAAGSTATATATGGLGGGAGNGGNAMGAGRGGAAGIPGFGGNATATAIISAANPLGVTSNATATGGDGNYGAFGGAADLPSLFGINTADSAGGFATANASATNSAGPALAQYLAIGGGGHDVLGGNATGSAVAVAHGAGNSATASGETASGSGFAAGHASGSSSATADSGAAIANDHGAGNTGSVDANGNGTAGGSASSTASAMNNTSIGDPADRTAQAYANATGGLGGSVWGVGQVAGAAGTASATASAISTGNDAIASATVHAFHGGTGFGGASGGDGVSIVQTNAVSGSSPTSLSLYQTLHAGGAGASTSGIPGAPGNATSTLNAVNPGGGAIHAIVDATAGEAGTAFDVAHAIRGGDAVATVVATSANNSIATAGASASAGVGSQTLNTADQPAVTLGIGGNATASATAVGAGEIGASATARGGGWATRAGDSRVAGSAAADAIGTGTIGMVTAQTASGALHTVSVDVFANSSVAAPGSAAAFTQHAIARAGAGAVQDPTNPALGAGMQSVAFASADPTPAQISTCVAGHPFSKEAMAVPDATALGVFTLGGGYPADAPDGLTFQSISNAAISIDAGALKTADVKFLLLDTQSGGNGFVSLKLEIDDLSGGFASPLVQQTFANLADAQAYFTDHVIDLSSIGVMQSGVYGLSATLTLTSDHASSFEATMGMAGVAATPDPGAIGVLGILAPVLLRRRRNLAEVNHDERRRRARQE